MKRSVILLPLFLIAGLSAMAQVSNSLNTIQYAIPPGWHETVQRKSVTLSPDAPSYQLIVEVVYDDLKGKDCQQMLALAIGAVPLQAKPVAGLALGSFCRISGTTAQASGTFPVASQVSEFLSIQNGYAVMVMTVAANKESAAKYGPVAEQLIKSIIFDASAGQAIQEFTYTYRNFICSMPTDWTVGLDSVHTSFYAPDSGDEPAFKISLFQGDSINSLNKAEFDETWNSVMNYRGYTGKVPTAVYSSSESAGWQMLKGEAIVKDEKGIARYMKMYEIKAGPLAQIVAVAAADKVSYDKYERYADELVHFNVKYVNLLQTEFKESDFSQWKQGSIRYVLPSGWRSQGSDQEIMFGPQYRLEGEVYALRFKRPIDAGKSASTEFNRLWQEYFETSYSGNISEDGDLTYGEGEVQDKNGRTFLIMLFLQKANGQLYPYTVETNYLVTLNRMQMQTEWFLESIRFGK